MSAAAEDLCAAFRELAEEIRRERHERERLANTVEELQRTVGRYVVVLERQLASNEQAKAFGERNRLPNANVSQAIRDEVRRKMRGQK